MTRWITTIVILVTVGVLIAYDIVIAVEDTPNDTLSRVTLDSAYNHPFIPFATGVLVGHLFWPMRRRKKWIAITSLIILSCVGVGVLVVDILRLLPSMNPIIGIAVGVPAGHYGWAQKKNE